MCKIAIMPGITDATLENAWKFIKEMSEEMGLTDDDGWGYAALDAEGKLFGERWFDPKDAFKHRNKGAPPEIALEEKFGAFFKPTKESKVAGYNDFGNVHEKSLRCAILHARRATCAKTMANLHPFVIGDTALVHNGVISNTEELAYKVSTCDSECILTEYIKNDVVNDLKNIQKMADKLQGSYACGVISKMADGTQIIDVFRDSFSKLRGYFIKELNTIVFGTTSHSADYGPIVSACKDLRFTIVKEYEIPDHRVVRLNAMTGEVMAWMEFDGTYKGKKNRGGNGGNKQLTIHGTDVYDRHRQIFGAKSKEHSGRHKNWSNDQKEKEVERLLVEGEFNWTGYEEYKVLDDDKTLPPIPNGDVKSIGERKKVWEADFYPDETGMWHKRTGTNK